MADEQTPAQPEIDVDTLDDAAFADLKTKMRAEPSADATQAPKEPTAATPVAKTEEPAPEATSDDDEAPLGPDGKKQEVVPHALFHRTNERRKQAEARAAEQQERADKAFARLQQLIEQQTAPQAKANDPPAIPEWDGDPMGAGKWTQQQLIEIKQQLEQRNRAEQEQAQRNQVLSSVNTRLAQSIQVDPSVKDAHNALRRSIGQELMAYGRTEQQAIEEINAIEVQHAAHIAANNLDPGKYIKTLAAARGWAQQQPASAVNENMSEAEKLTKREETRLAAQSLGKGAGSVAETGKLSPQDVLDMTDEEFLAYKNKFGSVAHAFRAA